MWQYKYGTIYRDVLRVRSFDWCDAVNRRSVQSLFTKFYVDMLEENAPEMIHPCPYIDIIFDKVALKTTTVGSIFPSGDYKIYSTLKDGDQNLLGSSLVVHSINSSNKDTFG